MARELDPIVHQQTRLRILVCLARNGHASFTDLRDGLALTPGNLQSHAARLEEAGYIRSGRVLVDLSFELRYRLTEAGLEALHAYLDRLAEILTEAVTAGRGAPTIPEDDALPRS